MTNKEQRLLIKWEKLRYKIKKEHRKSFSEDYEFQEDLFLVENQYEEIEAELDYSIEKLIELISRVELSRKTLKGLCSNEHDWFDDVDEEIMLELSSEINNELKDLIKLVDSKKEDIWDKVGYIVSNIEDIASNHRQNWH